MIDFFVFCTQLSAQLWSASTARRRQTQSGKEQKPQSVNRLRLRTMELLLLPPVSVGQCQCIWSRIEVSRQSTVAGQSTGELCHPARMSRIESGSHSWVTWERENIRSSLFWNCLPARRRALPAVPVSCCALCGLLVRWSDEHQNNHLSRALSPQFFNCCWFSTLLRLVLFRNFSACGACCFYLLHRISPFFFKLVSIQVLIAASSFPFSVRKLFSLLIYVGISES